MMMISNSFLDADDEVEEEGRMGGASPAVETAARLLYGLIHARFIISPNGLHKMVNST